MEPRTRLAQPTNQAQEIHAVRTTSQPQRSGDPTNKMSTRSSWSCLRLFELTPSCATQSAPPRSSLHLVASGQGRTTQAKPVTKIRCCRTGTPSAQRHMFHSLTALSFLHTIHRHHSKQRLRECQPAAGLVGTGTVLANTLTPPKKVRQGRRPHRADRPPRVETAFAGRAVRGR